MVLCREFDGGATTQIHSSAVAEFPQPDPVALQILTYCDMTVGPQGQQLSVQNRLANILERYDEGGVVHRSIVKAADDLRMSVETVERMLADQSQ